MSELTTTELGLEVPVSVKTPEAWSGGEHDGSRLTPQQRAAIMAMLAENWSDKKIAEHTKHSRNTIAALRADPARADWLMKTRAARHLAREESLMLEANELMDKLSTNDKLKLADVTSAMIASSMAIKDAGGAAPQRIRVEADPSLIMAAQIFSGQFKPVQAAPVYEAEMVTPLPRNDETRMTNEEVANAPAMPTASTAPPPTR